jgi:exodeoxyribonuclease VII small subunit
MKNERNLEEAMNRLEEIANILEMGDTSLEESIKLYEEGTQLIDFCNSKLKEAEKKILKLVKTPDDKFQLDPLDESGNLNKKNS